MWGLTQVIGSSSGSVLSLDDVPNTTAPSASRVCRIKRTTRGNTPPKYTFRLYCLNGTQVAGTLWVFDETTQLWVAAGLSLSATPAGPQQQSIGQNDYSNARAFFQLTLVTLTTWVGWDYW